MKKRYLFFIVTMILFCFTGCGGREAYAGKWEASEMVLNDSHITELSGIPLNAIMRFELNSSGSAEWKSPMENVKDPSKDGITAHWKIKDGKVILTVSQPDKDESVMEFEPKDGKLVISRSNAEIYMVKVDEYSPVDTEAMKKLFGNLDLNSMLQQ